MSICQLLGRFAVTIFVGSGLANSNLIAVAQSVDFHTDILPVLNDRCAGCHGGVKKNGGFRVLSRELLLEKTDSGEPAVVPGDVNSLLLKRITASDIDQRMPPKGHDPLTATETELLIRWVKEGAVWPEHWAYGAVPPLTPAAVFNGQHPVDWFVAQQLAQHNIAPAPPADALTLTRRLSLDLIGLLPEPAVIEQLLAAPEPFAADSPALVNIIDTYLASPHFGERWGRHWLDEARYADSEGYEKDSVKEDAYRFRNWVINAINNDMPFDEFTRKQLAGDLLPNATHDDLIATKFHLQTQFNLEGGVDSEEDRTKRVIDRVGTVGSVWMGASIACCQCHDHPYDDFRQEDFYRLYAFFNNTELSADFLGDEPADADKKRAERDKRWKTLAPLLEQQLTDKNLSDQTQSQLSQLRTVDNSSGITRYLAERTSSARSTYVFTRGDFQRPMVERGEVVAGIPQTFGTLSPRGKTADRLDLANWLVDPRNPLTARVAVNKIWMHLFGQPLAEQPQEFGSRGSPPSHPELLDYLARWFVDEAGYSRKQLIRFIVTSKTYQQSSKVRPELVDSDPNNRLLARQNRFRVEAEIVRDISLQAANLLSTRVGGKSVFPPLPAIITQQTYAGSNKYKASTGEDRYRRGLYTFFRRTAIDPNLSTFDCPDSSLTRSQRDRSNNPLQALATLHNEVFHEAAQAFAARLLQLEASSDSQRLQAAFRISVNRAATESEQAALQQVLAKGRDYYSTHSDDAMALVGEHSPPGLPAAETAAWVTVARVILNTDEFLSRN
ncbi:MAG: PSD1 and planctomycete cytochrome C domain-containing protein [Planctomycetaceae bacterium]